MDFLTKIQNYAPFVFILSYAFCVLVSLSSCEGRSIGNKIVVVKRDGVTENNSENSTHKMQDGKNGTNSQKSADEKGYFDSISENPEMLKRMLYLMLAITAVAVIFFVFKTVRGKRRHKTKKYGVLATPNTEVELRPLDEDDDDEDLTVFDANNK